jgi:hypothetical protein
MNLSSLMAGGRIWLELIVISLLTVLGPAFVSVVYALLDEKKTSASATVIPIRLRDKNESRRAA